MKLWHISQTEKNGYDTYDSAVVAAIDEDHARMINPDGKWRADNLYGAWCSTPDKVTVKYLGEAAPGIEQGIILASFNAG